MHWIRVKYSLFFLPDGKRFCRLHFQSVWLSGFCPAAAVLLHPLFCSPGAAGTDAGRSRGLSQEEGGSTAASPAAKQHTITALHCLTLLYPERVKVLTASVNQAEGGAAFCCWNCRALTLTPSSSQGPGAYSDSSFSVTLFTCLSFLLSSLQCSSM